MANILVLAWGTGGDVFPFIEIGKALMARGHQVTLLSNRKFQGVINGLGLDFAPLDTTGQVEARIEQEHQLESLKDLNQVGLEHHVLLYTSIFKTIKERWQPGETILVGHYDLQFALQIAAEKLAVPYIPVYIAPYFVTKMPCAEIMYQTNGAHVERIRAELGLQPVQDWSSWLRAPRSSIGLWPEWFAEPAHNWPPGLVPVGFMWAEDTNPRDASDDVNQIGGNGQRPVLITHGTSAPIKPQFFSASVAACEMLGYQPVVVTQRDELIPSSANGQVKHYRYLPYGVVMPQMAAVIHHGGIGTCAQSLAHGKPQLVLAHQYDRPDNGMRLQALGVAESLPPAQWETDRIARALDELTHSPAVAERCRDFANRINGSSAVATACKVIEETLARQDVTFAGESYSTSDQTMNANINGQESHLKRYEHSSRVAKLSPAKQALLKKRRLGKFPAISRNTPAPTFERVTHERERFMSFALEYQVKGIWDDPGEHEICTRCYRLTGTFNEAAMQQAVNEVARRHEILRTCFPLVDGRVTQIIASSMTMPMKVIDAQDIPQELPEAERLEQAVRIGLVEAQRPYDLSREPLWRVVLVRLSENDHLLMINTSHDIVDAWSWDLIVRDCWLSYEAFSTGNPSPLADPPIQFVDYAYWQRKTLQGQALDNLLSYWKRQLDGLKLIPEIRLPIERPLSQEVNHGSLFVPGAFQYLKLPAALRESLLELCRREGVTMYMLLMAALVALLHRYTGGDDFGIPSPITKRFQPETREVVGPFTCTIVLRTRLNGVDTFSALLKRVRNVVLEAYDHQDLPFMMFPGNTEEMWNAVNYPSIRFNMQKVSGVCGVDASEGRDEAQIPGLHVTSVNLPRCEDELWDMPGIVVHAQDTERELYVAAAYERERYEAAAIMELLENYRTILEGAATRPEQRLSEFPIVITKVSSTSEITQQC